MGDKTSSFVIAFDGSEGTLDAVVSALKGKIRSAVSEIQATASKVDLFANLETDVQKAAQAFAAATASVASLKTQIDSIKGAGGSVGDDLAAQFRLAETAATAASRAYNAQVTQLTALQTKLSAAGVNTGQLAAEQLRLAEALKVATVAAAEQNAKGLLGFKSLGDVQPQITALTKAFDTLRLSGKLSATEITAAQDLLQQKIAKVRGEVSVLSDRFSEQGTSISSIFTTATAKILGFVAVIGTIGSAISTIVATSRAFAQGIAEIGSVTELSKEQLQALGEGAKQVAADIGIDLVEAVKTLKELIRSGIDPDNALLVLAASAETAKASQQDLGAVVKVGTQLIHGYGIEIGDLQKTFDILFQGMKDGGPTFTELADSLGPLLSVAKLAHIPIDELAASLQVMVRAGVPAETAVTSLTKIIGKVDTAVAVKNLADLGIQAHGLADLFAQLGEKGLDLNQILQIGLADKRSLAGLAALTSGAGGLREEMDRLAKSSGASAAALAKLADTPKEKIERLSAAFQILETNIGANAARAGGLIDILNKVITVSNALLKSEQEEDAALAKFGNTAGLQSVALGAAFDKLTASAAAAANGIKNAISSIAGVVSSQIGAIDAKITEISGSLQTFSTNLQAAIAASQASAAAGIADLSSRAAAQIAALDKSTAAEKATAEATLAIQTKLAADRLALIVKTAADVLKAADAEAAAQLALAKQSGKDIATVEQSTAQTKLAILAQVKSQLTAALAEAVAQEQAYVGKINAIDQTRVSFNQGVQDKLTAIRNEGLSDFDQYIAKTGQINDLLAKAAAAFQEGGAAGLALGKTYTDQVIALSGQLKTVVNADGVEVISAFDVQQKKIEVITKAAGQYNQALDDQKAAATAGKDASVAAIDAVAPKLADITKQYDDLNAKVQAGLAIKITTDEAQITQAIEELRTRLEEKALLVPLKVDLQGLTKDVDDVVAKLKAGVTDGVNEQLDAIKANLEKIAAEAPELKLDTGPATTQIDALKGAVNTISDLKPRLFVDSNVADVQAAIDKLKLPTESTHTVHVVVEGGSVDTTTTSSPITPFALGGAVGSLRRARNAWQDFAGGGFSFPALASSKVPGVGNEDSVPASLPRGAFVMRKAAAQLYGDANMLRLAARKAGVRFLATGGFGFGLNDRGLGTSPDPQKLSFYDQFRSEVAKATANTGPSGFTVTDPNAGYQSGQSFQGVLPPPITLDTRAIPASLLTAANVIAYAQEMLLRVGGAGNSLLGGLGQDLLANLQAAEADSTNTTAIAQLLRDAETIGANPYIFSLEGKSVSSRPQLQPEWFYDWLEQTHAGDLAAALQGGGGSTTAANTTPVLSSDAISEFARRFFASSGFGQIFYTQNPLATIKAFADGGDTGTDTVNAMLTPGEYVISAPRAAQIGAPLLHALNNMQVSPEDLSSFMSMPAPRRPAMRFAEGGPVGDLWGNGGSRLVGGQPGQVNNFNMSLNVADLFSADNVRRFLLPVLREIDRRGK